MEHKIINTGDYLLIVDDSKIKEGDLLFKNTKPSFVKVKYGWNNTLDLGYRKIIAHLPLNNSPILEGVDLLPPLEDEVEKLAKQEAEKFHNKIKHDDWDIYNQLVYEDTEMIKIGYNKAKEKYKYTEEDMKRIYEKGYSAGRNELNSRESDKIKYDYIQSLQQPQILIGFKYEVKYIAFKEEKGNLEVPKTFINSQGLTQWVGEYIYE